MRRILFTETDFNTLPNPPAGFKYIGFDGPNFTQQGATGAAPISGGATVVAVTHSGLLTLIGAGDLNPGTYYNITDFKTCYDQPDYILGDGAPIPVDGRGGVYPAYKMGSTHSILVLALDVDKLSLDAYQPDYPKDQIKYDVTWNATEKNEEIAYGRITERIDEFGNRTDYDHREVVFKRYAQYSYKMAEHLLPGTIELLEDGTIIGTNSTFTDLSEGDVIALPNFWQRLFKITSIVNDYTMSVTGSSIPNTGTGNSIYSTTNDGYYEYTRNNIDPDDYVELPAFNAFSYSNYFGDNSALSEFLLPNNVFQGTFYANIFGDFCSNNTIINESIFFGNNIGDGFIGNTITKEFYLNRIGSSFRENILHADFISNQIGSDFSENEIGVLSTPWNAPPNLFEFNRIGDGCKGNFIDGYFGKNQIEYGFAYNQTLGDFGLNSIESYFVGNDTSNDFTANKIGSWFSGNEISYNFGNNSIRNGFEFNTISHNFAYNEIGNNFSQNEIENDFGFGGGVSRGNKIGNNFRYNTIGEYFYDNTIVDNFADNTIGNYFQMNNVKSQGIGEVDFTAYYGKILPGFQYGYPGTLPNEAVGTTFSNVSGTYSYGGSTASVVDATFDIYVASETSVVVTLVYPGKYYLPYLGLTSSEIAISDSKFGGTGANDLSILVSEVSDLPSVYGGYNTEIFKKAGGVTRLSYYDSSDILTITDIDK